MHISSVVCSPRRTRWGGVLGLSELLLELKNLTKEQLEGFIPYYWEMFQDDFTVLEMAIETLDYVLSQKNSDQFLLWWSI